MKILTRGFFAACCAFYCVGAMAADKTIEYKCHMELVGGDQVVNYISSPLANARLLQGQMQGKTIFGKDGVSRKYIYQVFECVKAKQSFGSVDAQTLDKKTLS